MCPLSPGSHLKQAIPNFSIFIMQLFKVREREQKLDPRGEKGTEKRTVPGGTRPAPGTRLGHGRTALLQAPNGEEGQEEEEEGTQCRAVGSSSGPSGGEARREGRPSATGATGREGTGTHGRSPDP